MINAPQLCETLPIKSGAEYTLKPAEHPRQKRIKRVE